MPAAFLWVGRVGADALTASNWDMDGIVAVRLPELGDAVTFGVVTGR